MRRMPLVVGTIAAAALLCDADVVHASTTSDPSPTLRLKVDFSHPNPSVGSQIHYRVRLENTGFKAVRVPADVMSYLNIFGWQAMPWDARKPSIPALPAQRPVEKSSWRVLKPDSFIDVRGRLSELFAECRGGCRSGDYHLVVRLSHPGTVAAPPKHKFETWLPKGLRTTTKVSVTPHRLPVGSEAVTLSLAGARQLDADTVEVRAVFENTSTVAIWVPRPHKLDISCNARVIEQTDTRMQTTHHRKRADSPWREPEGVMLAPGHRFTQALACHSIRLNDVISAHIRIRVRPSTVFFPTTVVSPYYLDSVLKTAEIPIERPVRTASR